MRDRDPSQRNGKALRSPSGARLRGKQPGQKRFYADIWPGRAEEVPEKLATAVLDLEKALAIPVVMFIQFDGPFDEINDRTCYHFFQAVQQWPQGQEVAFVIESPGEYARPAYRMATLFRRHCGKYTAVVPNYAKSAATLFTLGAERILLGWNAELGPLDAQVADIDREQRLSALEVVQALERLNSEAIDAVDQQMIFWGYRSGKKFETLLPIVTSFVAQMMKPLFDKIDTVHYTQMARVLKVAQDYAVRLLMPRYKRDTAEMIASTLTEAYPEHEFVVDPEEIRRIGLAVEAPKAEIQRIIERIAHSIEGQTFIGRVREFRNGNKDTNNENGKQAARRGRRRGRNSTRQKR
jgi:hypothetical protein